MNVPITLIMCLAVYFATGLKTNFAREWWGSGGRSSRMGATRPTAPTCPPAPLTPPAHPASWWWRWYTYLNFVRWGVGAQTGAAFSGENDLEFVGGLTVSEYYAADWFSVSGERVVGMARASFRGACTLALTTPHPYHPRALAAALDLSLHRVAVHRRVLHRRLGGPALHHPHQALRGGQGQRRHWTRVRCTSTSSTTPFAPVHEPSLLHWWLQPSPSTIPPTTIPPTRYL